jgi:hypothetical protein
MCIVSPAFGNFFTKGIYLSHIDDTIYQVPF